MKTNIAQYRDYQGAVRATVAGGRTCATNHYYPYGVPFATMDDFTPMPDRRLYGDKELLTFMGYNTYDYSARHYYAAASCFDTPDPMAGEKTWISPYSFCSGDPINRIDPSGMTDYYNIKGEYVHHIEDQKNDNMVLLIESKGMPEIENALSKGHIIPVMTEKVVDTLEKMSNTLDDTPPHEQFVVIGKDGSVSDIVDGEAERVPGEVQGPQIEKIGAENVAYDVHTHPAKYPDGTERLDQNSTGWIDASPGDLRAVGEGKVNAIITKQHVIGPYANGTNHVVGIKSIFFYDSSGPITPPIEIRSISNSMKKIRNHIRKKEAKAYKSK